MLSVTTLAKITSFRTIISVSDLANAPPICECLETVVAALDTAGTVGKVWQGGLLEKLLAKGVQGDFLLLLETCKDELSRWSAKRRHSFNVLLVGASVSEDL